MTDDEVIEAVVAELQGMGTAGADAASMLRRLQHMFGREDCKLLSIVCFRKAFGAGIASLSAIPGWRGFGGELSDAQLNADLLWLLEEYRRASSN